MSTPEGSETWHGTPGGYRYHGCRGEKCKRAHAESMRRYRRARTATGKGRFVHGMWRPREES